MDRCDLHTHSIFSDGTCTPETLCQQAKLLGLKSLALTDHNTTQVCIDFVLLAVHSAWNRFPVWN